MDQNMIWGYIILILSCLLLVIAIAALIVKKTHKIWYVAGFMFFSVLLLHISLNVAYPYDYSGVNTEKLNISDILTRIVAHTFQAFSLDLDYNEIIATGYAAFYCEQFKCGVYIFYTMSILMTVLAPATGGFAVFGVLLHFFPYLRFVFSFSATKFIFSELNECSIETAESIARKKEYLKKHKNERKIYGEDRYKRLKKSIIIFTDVYVDSSEERSSELLERAKKIGAVCMRDDVLERKIFWLFRFKNKKAVYFLVDVQEENNLKIAVSLLTDDKKKMMWARCKARQLWTKTKDVELYVFNKNEDAYEIINTAYKNLKKSYKDLKVQFKVINEFKNLVYRLIGGYELAENEKINRSDIEAEGVSYPLYYSLFKDNGVNKWIDLSKLSVVIVGGGRIGKEFFKAAYWCGQMIASKDKNGFVPTKLTITVISQYATETRKGLRFEMPEAFDRSEAEYFNAHFIDAEFGESGDEDACFEKLFKAHCKEADYVLVALGNDDLNIRAANWVKRTLDRYNIGNLKNVPINYVIENKDLCDSLQTYHYTQDKNTKDDKENKDIRNDRDKGCILHPFGSLSHRYDVDNIYMSGIEKLALVLDNANDNESDEDCECGGQFIADDYKRNSSVASVIHYSYKLVSLGILKELKLLKIDKTEPYFDFTIDFKNNDMVDALCWLEHRRWCAYIRSTGYTCPTAKEFYYYAFKDGMFITHKNERLKYHPCLVSSGPTYKDLNSYLKEEDIKKEIEKLSQSKTDLPLEDWLNDIIPDKELDALEKISLIASSFGQYKNFKDNDIRMVRTMSEYYGKTGDVI